MIGQAAAQPQVRAGSQAGARARRSGNWTRRWILPDGWPRGAGPRTESGGRVTGGLLAAKTGMPGGS